MEETRDDKSLSFHYNRGERLAAKGGEKPPQPKGLFRRNRSLAIILLDVTIVVIMFLLFQLVFTPGKSWTRVGDYRIDVSAFRFEDEVYATVEISRVREGSEQASGADSLVVVRFAGREDVLDVLPTAMNGRTTATTIYAAADLPGNSPVTVELDLLGESVSLICTPKD